MPLSRISGTLIGTCKVFFNFVQSIGLVFDLNNENYGNRYKYILKREISFRKKSLVGNA